MAEDILVVDDEPSMVRVLQLGLEARGYQVRVAANARQALDEVRYEEPAVVLLDLGLPDMDGLDVCERLRRHTSCSVIVITAFASFETAVTTIKAGAADYLPKPFTPAQATQLVQ